MRRFAFRRDANENEIVRKIKSVPGYLWTSLPPDPHQAGRLADGLFRLASWPDGECWLVEVKTEKGKLSPEQAVRRQHGWTIVIRSFDELHALVQKRVSR